MKRKDFNMTTFKKAASLFLSLTVLFFLFSGCDSGSSSGGTASGVSSSRLFVPSGSNVTGAVTVSGGFTNTKEQMYWLAEALQDGGIIALAISASNNSSIGGYENAHRGGLTILRNDSTIRSRLGKLGIMGFSMGGGAVINLGATDGVDVVVAMAPYSPNTPSRSHDAATMILTGTSDSTAPARMGEGAYNNLPSTTPRLYTSLSGKSHTYWMTSGSKGSEVDFIVAWSQYYLNGNQAAYSEFSQGPASGMTNYKFNPGNGGSSSSSSSSSSSTSSSSSSGGCN
jgi:hypothetical protein